MKNDFKHHFAYLGYRSKKPKFISEYKGFDIYYAEKGSLWSDYFAIYKDGDRATQLALISEKACKNVIDTHLKFNEK